MTTKWSLWQQGGNHDNHVSTLLSQLWCYCYTISELHLVLISAILILNTWNLEHFTVITFFFCGVQSVMFKKNQIWFWRTWNRTRSRRKLRKKWRRSHREWVWHWATIMPPVLTSYTGHLGLWTGTHGIRMWRATILCFFQTEGADTKTETTKKEAEGAALTLSEERLVSDLDQKGKSTDHPTQLDHPSERSVTSAGSEKQHLQKRFLLPWLTLVNMGCVVVCTHHAKM